MMGMKKRLKSLEQLKKLTLDRKDEPVKSLIAKGKRAEEKKTEPQPPDNDNEDNIFSAAMLGVRRMDGTGTGRQVTPKPEKGRPVPLADNSPKNMDDVMKASMDFELEYTDEYMHGFVRGLDSKTFYQLKAGALSREASLDLHGLNSEQALDTLLFFIRESYLQSKRCLLIVTGRGKNSPGGRSVLKQEIQSWLTKEPLRKIVLAFCTAQPKDGGAGALYILLRKQKKQKGRVQWDRMMNWNDDI